MDEKEIGRVWTKYYPKSGDNRDALQICRMICRLIRAETRLVFSISRSGRLQRVLDACGILKADFDEIEKRFFKV
jgi:DNA-binding XRE family transcriptional regulator